MPHATDTSDPTTIIDTNDTATPSTGHVDSETAVAAPARMLDRGPTIDPALLDIAENVRKNFRLDEQPEFTESVREHGVKSPIKVIRMPDGRLVVRDGQLRTLTALALEQTEVPVWITDFDPAVDPDEAEIRRIIEQINVNDRRIPLTPGDRAAAIALAIDYGATVTRVAQALQTKRDKVKLAGKVGASPTAMESLDGQFTLEQAAVIAEYDALGDTAAVERLARSSPTWFPYQANRIAQDRDETRNYLTAALPYAEAGFRVLTNYPEHDSSTDSESLISAAELVDTDGEAVDVNHITTDPGFWLVWLELGEDTVWVETDTGDLVDPHTVDFDTLDDPDAEPAEGLRHAREVQSRQQIHAEYFLPRDLLETVGLREREADTNPGNIDQDEQGEQSAAGRFAAGRRTAAARTEAAQTEAARERERVVRRRVRELNKQGLAAQTTRTEFVQRLVRRKTLPAQAPVFLAQSLVSDYGLLSEYTAFDMTSKLLGTKSSPLRRDELLATLETTKPARALVIVLALVLGGYENRAGKDLWRYADRGVRRYLAFLRELGHPLVPVEQAALGEIAAADIDIDTPAPEPNKPQQARAA
ncbi:ParB N-terminal domain-containing protein [Nocardia sp. CNY236]|uniref:ParB/RepB/Spo0J family partition protein n=1 Tax=Nocardia sp. CNY236 TaxID=1169152 RepID=UPI0003FCDE58|nr:ParB N-terminal domain-containing protein [Nocardia sp. CNY236]